MLNSYFVFDKDQFKCEIPFSCAAAVHFSKSYLHFSGAYEAYLKQ